MELTTNLKLNEVLEAKNVAELLEPEDLETIAADVWTAYQNDVSTRAEWEQRYAEYIKLAMQVMEKKTWPWQDASNVKYPLVTQAMLQFHARAYPATVPGFDVVGCRVIGDDPKGEKDARAQRVSQHMSYQCMEEDTQWEESHDKTLIVMSVVGCCFKKTYFDPIKRCPISEIVLPADLVVNYFTKSLDRSPCVTQVLDFTKNDCVERANDGRWLEMDDTRPAQPITNPITEAKDTRQGLTAPPINQLTPYTVLEQHRFMDLDGDGYEEPYVVTLVTGNRQVVRITPRFVKEGINRDDSGKLLKITPEQVYTKYEFVPSPDGGFYGMGFGQLLGGLNHAVDTMINQTIDAATLKNMGGGFMGKGVKVLGGNMAFKPGEWKRVESTGQSLKDNFFTLPVNEPSNALIQALELLIQVGNQLGMATGALVGENPGQNTKTGVHEDVQQQGEKVFNGIYKRIYRALKMEFRKRYRLNYFNPPKNGKWEYAHPENGGGAASVQDYFVDDHGIVPGADPDITDQRELRAHASLVRSAAYQVPGYNRYLAEKNWLKAMKVSGIDVLFPDPKGPNAQQPMPNPKVLVEQIKQQGKQQDRQLKKTEMLLKIQEEIRLNTAKITKLTAEAEHLKAQTKDVENDHMLDFFSALLESAHKDQDRLLQQQQMMMDQQNETQQGGPGGMAQPPGN